MSVRRLYRNTLQLLGNIQSKAAREKIKTNLHSLFWCALYVNTDSTRRIQLPRPNAQFDTILPKWYLQQTVRLKDKQQVATAQEKATLRYAWKMFRALKPIFTDERVISFLDSETHYPNEPKPSQSDAAKEKRRLKRQRKKAKYVVDTPIDKEYLSKIKTID